MNVTLKKFMICGIAFTIVVGSLLHFVYEWSGDNLVVGIFSAVNESTWEHLKLIFVPMLFYCLICYFFVGKSYSNYFPAMLKGISVGLLAIVAIFYTYTGVLGKNYLSLDILTFVIAVIWGFSKMYEMLIKEETNGMDFINMKCNVALSILGLFALTSGFLIFTFYPPELGLFITKL